MAVSFGSKRPDSAPAVRITCEDKMSADTSDLSALLARAKYAPATVPPPRCRFCKHAVHAAEDECAGCGAPRALACPPTETPK